MKQKAVASAVLPLCVLLSWGSAAHADPRSIGTGATLTPFDIGHIFAESCFEADPARLENNARVMGRVLSLNTKADGRDGPVIMTDLSDVLVLTARGRRSSASCIMEIQADAVGDGADLYESVEDHLDDWRDGDLPEADYVDGGLTWAWDERNTTFTLTYTEVPDTFTLALDVKR